MGRAERERIVREHIESENRHDTAATVATFAAPRYEVVPTGEVHAGPEAVGRFLDESQRAFPDMGFTLHALHHADDALLVEVSFEATHLGSFRGLPATGRRVSYRMCNVFQFDGDRLVCERLYFDLQTVLRQIGIARDPTSPAGQIAAAVNHPITVIGAVLRGVFAGRRR
jgi:steroid delta-isomerase-like uncharacterized protein